MKIPSFVNIHWCWGWGKLFSIYIWNDIRSSNRIEMPIKGPNRAMHCEFVLRINCSLSTVGLMSVFAMYPKCGRRNCLRILLKYIFVGIVKRPSKMKGKTPLEMVRKRQERFMPTSILSNLNSYISLSQSPPLLKYSNSTNVPYDRVNT